MTSQVTTRYLGYAAFVLGFCQGLLWAIAGIIFIVLYRSGIPDFDAATYLGRVAMTLYIIYIYDLNGMLKGSPTVFLYIACFYLGLSIMWMSTSFSLLRGKEFYDRSNRVKRVFLSWSTFAGLTICLDIFFMAVCAIDFDFVLHDPSFKSNDLLVSSIGIMLIISTKGIVLFILNVTFAIILFKKARSMKVSTPTAPQVFVNYQQPSMHYYPNVIGNQRFEERPTTNVY